MPRPVLENRTIVDGIAALFFLMGVGLIVANKGQNMTNVGWIFVLIGVVKQLKEWK